jgi:CRISPR-associated protein Cas1
MRNRILDFTEHGAYLKLQLNNLVVERHDKEISRIPMEDIAVLVLANQQVVVTQSVLAALLEYSGIVVVCGINKMPLGMTLPLRANYVQTERFRQQINVTKPVRKRLWQQVIRAKIKAQGKLLHEIHGNDFGLFELSGMVKSGDTGNLESRAAVVYWQELFNEKKISSSC